MASVVATNTVGDLLRDWRQRRRFSQLDLALLAEVSTRHLSFVETGRSKPSRELLLHLADHLDVPLRDRNTMLLAAGYAPFFPEHELDDEEMAPVRDALDKILAGHEPFPAMVVNGRWDLVAANAPLLSLMSNGVAPELMALPINPLRVCLHPDGLAPRILNLGEYSAHLLHRLHQQAVMSDDRQLNELYEELRSFPGVEETSPSVFEPAALVFSTLRILSPADEVLTFFSTFTTFGTAVDVTLAELAVESFFPADAVTEKTLRQLFDQRH